MAITLADFTKIWASTSPLTPYSFSDSNYQEGWNFIGSTPPARQMWDSIQKQNDEKLKYIVDNFLPLSGGTMTGAIVGNPLTLTADDGNGNSADLVINANGTATFDGNGIVTKKAEDISNDVTFTTNNGTIEGKTVYRVGNVVSGNFTIKTASVVNIGGTISGNISGLPQPVVSSFGVTFYSGAVIILTINASTYNVRVNSAQLPASVEIVLPFIYATVN